MVLSVSGSCPALETGPTHRSRPCLYSAFRSIPHVQMMAGYPVLITLKQQTSDWQLSVERMLDVVFSATVLVALWPFSGLISSVFGETGS